MISNDNDTNIMAQQFLKKSPGITWFQMMMIATLRHSKQKQQSWHYLISNDDDDDSNLGPLQF